MKGGKKDNNFKRTDLEIRATKKVNLPGINTDLGIFQK